MRFKNSETRTVKRVLVGLVLAWVVFAPAAYGQRTANTATVADRLAKRLAWKFVRDAVFGGNSVNKIEGGFKRAITGRPDLLKAFEQQKPPSEELRKSRARVRRLLSEARTKTL